MKASVLLSIEERQALKKFVSTRRHPSWLVQRSQILLKLGEGQGIRPISEELKISRNTVRLWKKRWETRLTQEEIEPPIPLSTDIRGVLSDAPRPGTPPTFSPEVAVSIVALACRKPEELDRPISHWTPRELASEAIKQEIVDTISHGTVQTFLKRSSTSTSSECLLASSKN